MNRLRSTSALVLALGMAGALTACGEDPTEKSADPAPSTAPALVLGPDGFGELELGMDPDQAVATGVVAPFEPGSAGCAASTALSGAPADEGLVYVSPSLGVAAIEAYPGVETPEGIGIGDPLSAVDAAYPGWDYSADLLRGWADVPGNDEAYYRIAVDTEDVVDEVTLQFVDQDCYE
jgi:hypothetical protein